MSSFFKDEYFTPEGVIKNPLLYLIDIFPDLKAENPLKRHRLGLHHQRQRFDCLNDGGVNRTIDTDKCNSVAARFGAAQVKGADIHIRLAQDRTQRTDKARLVIIAQI